MRDPQGKTVVEDGGVFRLLNQPVTASHFLHSSLASRWIERGDLVPYEWIDSMTIRANRIPFVTLPTEWCDSQFYSAAQLTLRLQQEALNEGWELKDASAWNIVFDGLHPIFVDLLSFQPLENQRWHAAGQFCRHFIFPLLIAKKFGVNASQSMALWRDGAPPNIVSKLMGPMRFLSRYWPLMLDGDSSKLWSDDANISASKKAIKQLSLQRIQEFRRNFHASLDWMMNGICPANLKHLKTSWKEYEIDRKHYDQSALDFKRETIQMWLIDLSPKWVLDVGSNAGEFSSLAVSAGANVICWDSDHGALSTIYYRHSQSNDSRKYHPILGAIDDVPGGRGWMGAEFPGLIHRLNQRVDVVMLLAVIHHLSISGGIPLEEIFRIATQITRKAVLIELVSEVDSRVRQMCQQYRRNPSDFTIQKQLEAAEKVGLSLIKIARRNSEDTREYAWMEKIKGQ